MLLKERAGSYTHFRMYLVHAIFLSHLFHLRKQLCRYSTPLPVFMYKHRVQMTIAVHRGEADDIALSVKCTDEIVLCK